MADLNLTQNDVKLLKLYIENSETTSTNWAVVAEKGGWKDAKCARDTWGIFKRKKLNAGAAGTATGTTPSKTESGATTPRKRKAGPKEEEGATESPTPSKKAKKGKKRSATGEDGSAVGSEEEQMEDKVKDEPNDDDEDA